MNPRLIASLFLALALSLAFASFSEAQWLQHTTVIPDLATTATFANAQPGYTGTVNTTNTVVTGGIVPGGGISPNPFTNLTPTFFSPAGFTTNPGGTFDYLNINYNDSDDVFDINMDFTGLQNHFLPAGSIIAFLDVDNFENILSLQADGGAITGWLSPLGSPQGLFDYDTAPGGVTPGMEAGFSGTGPYSLSAPGVNQDSAFQGFITTQNIRSLSFEYINTFAYTGVPEAGDLGIAIGMPQAAVPEPATTALLAIGAVAGLTAYRRRKALPKGMSVA